MFNTKKIERSRIQKTVMFSLLKEYKCQLKNEISWKNKATVNNNQQEQKQ